MASSSVINSKVWKGIWRAEASPKCKSFAWRAYMEELPVKTFLLEKGVIEDKLCPCCGEGEEDTTHALLACEEVKRIWFVALDLKVESLSAATKCSLSQWIEECVSTLDKKEMGMVCAIMWAIWHRRNALVFTEKKLDYAHVIAKARSMFVPVEWQPPSHPNVKANFAAAVRDNVGTGMGVIFRNSLGSTIASGTSLLAQECFESQIAETLCMSWAIEQSGELGLSDVIFETDCQRLYRKWNQESSSSSSAYTTYFESLVEDCKFMIEGTGSSLALVRPSANKVAQCLATLAFDYGERGWIEEVPQEASLYLQADDNAIADIVAAHQ
ncbi:uncharacterized protein LOC109813153 [Cajanus cajan]|uniref:uncharacterized protein LOC109813153 n=1 Tax=Cajanus cajan TaxID=3821 RepID=UPI00098D9560|nr:uncharacterized protein LOC109813153 [Cajanus cajan]